MRSSRELLHSFDPAERARGGRELIQQGLARAAKPVLGAMADEIDDRVVAAVARAVMAAPRERREPRRAAELRAWAASELERLALEDRFFTLGRDRRDEARANPRNARATSRPKPTSPGYISWRAPG